MKLQAWAILHNSHGVSLDTLIFLPEGEEPETNEDWVRLSWLDGELPKELTITEDQLRQLIFLGWCRGFDCGSPYPHLETEETIQRRTKEVDTLVSFLLENCNDTRRA